MSAAHKQCRVLKVGDMYLDRSRGVLVTLEEHEIRAGRRTGRVIVCAADGVLKFPRRWYCREPDLVPPSSGATAPNARARP
jgi:hypothetical protein